MGIWLLTVFHRSTFPVDVHFEATVEVGWRRLSSHMQGFAWEWRCGAKVAEPSSGDTLEAGRNRDK